MAGVTPTFLGMYLCGENACLDAVPLVTREVYYFNATASWYVSSIFEDSLNIQNISKNRNVSVRSAVCLLPLFFWIVSNTSMERTLNCSSQDCQLKGCWNHESLALVVHVPGVIPLPVKHSGEAGLVFLRQKREILE